MRTAEREPADQAEGPDKRLVKDEQAGHQPDRKGRRERDT